MALLFVDGFPYDISLITKRYDSFGVGYSPSIGTGSGRTANARYLIHPQCGGQYFVKALPANYQRILVQFGFYASQWWGPGIPALVTFSDGDARYGAQLSIGCANGKISAYRASSGVGTKIGEESGASVPANAWHQIEVDVTIDNSVGAVLVKVDNQTVLNLTGQDTQYTANAYCNKIRFGYGTGTEGDWDANTARWSDIIIMDTTGSYCNALLGPRIVQVCVPTADGSYKQWDRSAGSDNYANVDEVPPDDDTTYNYTETVGEIDTFSVTQLAAASAISAVVCSIYTKVEGGASVKGVARTGTTDGLGPEKAVAGSYNWLQSPVYVDPTTGYPFTKAGFNAAEFGYKRET
jgi:hypothetical protein